MNLPTGAALKHEVHAMWRAFVATTAVFANGRDVRGRARRARRGGFGARRAVDDPCARVLGDDDAVPCVHVSPCAAGATGLSPFVLVDSPAGAPPRAPAQNASATACFDERGLRFAVEAEDDDVFTSARACGDALWSLGAALEVFAAPVAAPRDAPVFYQETDVAPSGAAWAATINNTGAGNATNCLSPDGVCPGLSPATFECDGRGPASFSGLHDLIISATNTTRGWRADFALPWTLFAPYFGAGGETAAAQWPLWRVNVYRYDYPDPSDHATFELSGWSATHADSFHVPARFGVLVLSFQSGG